MPLLRDSIYQAIRDAILTCEFQPGQELREQVLAERFRVSRSPVRDSLLRLERENLVTVLPRQGYRVNPISISDAEDIFGLRLLIEPACTAAAAGQDITALRALDKLRGFAQGEKTRSQFIEYNRSFHRALVGLSPNARMAVIALDLVEQFHRLVQFTLQDVSHEQVRHAAIEHEAIIDAIQAHDADRAARLSYAHASGANARVAEVLRLIVPPGQNPPPTAAAQILRGSY